MDDAAVADDGGAGCAAGNSGDARWHYCYSRVFGCVFVFFKTILCAKMDLLGVVLMFYVFFFVFFGSFWLFLALFLSFFGHFYLQFDYQAKWRHSMPHMSQC